MKEFKDRVAVITGAASGIGRALADRCVQEGMKVVLADVEAATLAKTEASLRASGATVLAVRTNVSQAGDVEALARGVRGQCSEEEHRKGAHGSPPIPQPRRMASAP